MRRVRCRHKIRKLLLNEVTNVAIWRWFEFPKLCQTGRILLRIKLKLIFIIMKNDIAINNFSSILPHVYVMSPDWVAR